MKKMRAKRGEKGFTLVELMIVVAIIGILAAIAIPQYAAYKERAWIASMQGDINSIRSAEEAFFAANGSYTTSLAAGGLADFGWSGYSTGNSGTPVVTAGPPTTFSITVASTKTGKTVTYDSATGATSVST
jgi:type IV pilus assembly protein PilA